MKTDPPDALPFAAAPRFEGGAGATMEDAVVIRGVQDTMSGIRAERQYIAQELGTLGQDWHWNVQALHTAGDRRYDVIEVRLHDGTIRHFWFDISDFFGKL